VPRANTGCHSYINAHEIHSLRVMVPSGCCEYVYWCTTSLARWLAPRPRSALVLSNSPPPCSPWSLAWTNGNEVLGVSGLKTSSGSTEVCSCLDLRGLLPPRAVRPAFPLLALILAFAFSVPRRDPRAGSVAEMGCGGVAVRGQRFRGRSFSRRSSDGWLLYPSRRSQMLGNCTLLSFMISGMLWQGNCKQRINEYNANGREMQGNARRQSSA
jgi:hypothetical protein